MEEAELWSAHLGLLTCHMLQTTREHRYNGSAKTYVSDSQSTMLLDLTFEVFMSLNMSCMIIILCMTKDYVKSLYGIV